MEGICKGKKTQTFLFIGATDLLLIARNHFEDYLFLFTYFI